MLVLSIVETALLALAIIYIVALLRSHADILRRLAALEDGVVAVAPSRRAVPGPDGEAMSAGDITGVTPAGDSVKLSLGAGAPATLLAFLSSGCAACAPLWEGLREADEVLSLADRVVVVTHDAARESTSRLRALAPPGAELVMAEAAWEAYAVPASPHFVLTDGLGGIAGRGSALSLAQLGEMIGDARADREGDPLPAVRTTADRAQRAERALARSGIGPGHPSLCPSAVGPSEEGAR